jgi:hypothetical protein
MKQLCFLFFFIGFNLSIQAQNLNNKYMGTWVDNDSTHVKSMFFIGKNNEFIWTNINETIEVKVFLHYITRVGKYELKGDTLIVTLNKILHFSTNTGFEDNINCEINSQKWLLSKDSNSLTILEKYPNDNDLNKDRALFMSFRKFHIPTVRKYEKADEDYLKTESCKWTFWKDLIDLICK